MKHYVAKYLLNPNHKVTINLIGAGGNGSLMLSGIARMDYALRKLGHMGIHLRMFDADKVSDSNVGRQLFSPSDIGDYKSHVLISRVNRFFKNDWDSMPWMYDEELAGKHNYSIGSNFIISCVDTIEARKGMERIIMRNNSGRPYQQTYYWMDLGNEENTGQCILGTVGRVEQPKKSKDTTNSMPCVIEEFNGFVHQIVKDKDKSPSCSMAEALDKQDLFINQTLATHSLNLLWKMFRNGVIEHRGVYVNSNTMTVNPIKI